MKITILGVEVGECENYEAISETEILFEEVTFNSKGKELFCEDGTDSLTVDFMSGEVTLSRDDDEDEPEAKLVGWGPLLEETK